MTGENLMATPTTARWRKKSYSEADKDHYFFQATCGRCPGSLGRLVQVLNLEQHATTMLDLLVKIGEKIGPRLVVDDNGDIIGISPEDVPFFPDAYRVLEFACPWQDVKRLQQKYPDRFPREASWVMNAGEVVPASGSIYHGDHRAGYRISRTPGKRDPAGKLKSRRPYIVPSDIPVTLAYPTAELVGEDPRRVPVGQHPIPPCSIWCHLCGTLNKLPLPLRFVQRTDGTIYECTDAAASATMYERSDDRLM
jgi:hypothetical protein